jgi:hypothetical protein
MIEQPVLKDYRTRKIGERDAFMDLSFDREWDRIELVKMVFEQFAVSLTGNKQETFKIGIAVSELLENAVKYSIDTRVRIVIQHVDESEVFIICVMNKTDSQNIQRLRAMLREMRSMDSLNYYLYRMRESIKNKNASSGLGLARVCHEAQADISAKIARKKGTVEIRALIILDQARREEG